VGEQDGAADVVRLGDRPTFVLVTSTISRPTPRMI
jgi:hypothetical protein